MSENEEDEESEPEEDERIMKLVTFVDKHTPAETAAFLDKLGGDDALIYGSMFVGKENYAKAHFLIMGALLLDEDVKTNPLSKQLEEKWKLAKAAVPDEEAGAALLVMLELWWTKEVTNGCPDDWEAALKVLWERDIVSEESVEAWCNNERSLMELYPFFHSQEDAEAIRGPAQRFVAWLKEGEA